MPTVMEVGDIWRKDTTSLYEGNRVQHWLITNVWKHDVYEARWAVDFLHLETGRQDCIVLYTIDLTGNPYWKKVA